MWLGCQIIKSWLHKVTMTMSLTMAVVNLGYNFTKVTTNVGSSLDAGRFSSFSFSVDVSEISSLDELSLLELSELSLSETEIRNKALKFTFRNPSQLI